VTSTDRIRVVHLITDLDVGGAERALARLVAAMDRTRIDSTVVTLRAGGLLVDEIARHGIPVMGVSARGGTVGPRALWRLVTLLRQLRPTVLQTWLYHADLAGILAGRLAGVPAVAWNIRCAGLEPGDHSRLLRPMLSLLALLSARPAAVVCNSDAGRLAHERLGYHPRRWIMLPNGFDVDALTPDDGARIGLRRELGLAEDVTLVGVVARLHPMKDHATFLMAAAAIATRRRDVHFLLVGRGVTASVELGTLIRKLGLDSLVHRMEERLDARAVFGALDVAVSSSYSEAFPNVVAEAMACGTPCVVTDTGESAAIVGETGLVVPIRDPASLAEAILRLLMLEPDQRVELGKRARARIRSEYAIDRIARRYEALYVELAGQAA